MTDTIDNNNHICNFCSKKFSTKISLTKHQTRTKNCLTLQGKTNSIECDNCKKMLTTEYYKQHKIKCDQELEDVNRNKMLPVIQEKCLLLEKQNKKLKADLSESKKHIESVTITLTNAKNHLNETQIAQQLLEKENEKLKTTVSVLVKQLSILINYRPSLSPSPLL
jgi:hypothetical protein